jgi:DNA-binding response OmpR family regulator
MSARILIVEDQARIALGLQRQLTALGHQVVGIAGNAGDALKDASALKPDLIFMDIGLEGDIDGIAVASAIRGEENIPVIFLTAHCDDATLERAMSASPFGYVLKPFEAAEIKAAIKVALHRHRKELEDRTQLKNVLGQTPPP